MKILFLSGWFPYPPDNGSKIRIYNLLRGLAQSHDVTLLAFARDEVLPAHKAVLKGYCKKIETVPWKEYNPSSQRAVLGFFGWRPRSIVATHSSTMQRMIENEVRANPGYDLVIASELTMAAYQASYYHLPAILEDLELAGIADQYTNANSKIVRFRNGLNWLKLQRYVGRLVTGFNAVTVVSERERDILKGLAPTNTEIHIIPNCLNAREYSDIQAYPEPDSLIFSGALTYSANHEAIRYFLKDIYPLIKRVNPQVQLKITGKVNGRHFPGELLDRSVHLTGCVDNIKQLIASSWVSIVPIKTGGGTRLKILEALALGTPVVTTSKGREGLDLLHGQHLLIADAPEHFAEATIRLLNDPQLRNQLGQNGRKLIKEKYDWNKTLPNFLELVERLQDR